MTVAEWLMRWLWRNNWCSDCGGMIDWFNDCSGMTDVMTVAEWLMRWLWRNDWCDNCGGMTDAITVAEWLMRWMLRHGHCHRLFSHDITTVNIKKLCYKYSSYNTLFTDNKQGLHYIKLARRHSTTAKKLWYLRLQRLLVY